MKRKTVEEQKLYECILFFGLSDSKFIIFFANGNITMAGATTTSVIQAGNNQPVSSEGVAGTLSNRKVILWEGTATEGDTLNFTNKEMDINQYEKLEVVVNGVHIPAVFSGGTGNNVRLKAIGLWSGTDDVSHIGLCDYDREYIIDIISSKLINCTWYHLYNWTINSGILNRNVILGNDVNMIVFRYGNVVTVAIDGFQGSNISPDNFILVANNLPPSMGIANCVVKLDDPTRYQRAWVDGSGNLYVWVSNGVYTGNVFLSVTYCTPDYPKLKGGTLILNKIIGYKLL